MGAACRKPQEQVRTDEDEEAALRELNESLRRQKEALEAELARWKAANRDRLAKLRAEAQDLEDRAKMNLTAEELEALRNRAAAEIQREFAADEAKDLEQQQKQADYLKKELARLEAEKNRLENQRFAIAREGEQINALLADLDAEKVQEEEITEEASSLTRIGDYYRPVVMPKDAGECVEQTRIDAAECSSQTVRNTKALIHSFPHGDLSWYKTRPIRGVVCEALQCGDMPHDRWHCELCALLDLTDAPLLV